ncbi:MAG TPA: hemolysin III family protein [Oscillatoriaceae cyanobacterium]
MRTETMPGGKPLLRGHFHQAGFFVALGAGAMLVAQAPGARALISAIVYAASLATLLGVSALYHRPTWKPAIRRQLKKLDHSAIFLLIAGTATPFGLLALDAARGRQMLLLIWLGAALGILRAVFWSGAPRWVSAGLYVGLGWASLAYLPAIAASLAPGWMVPIVAGGLLYTVGAVVYASKRPDPAPTVFGYHEIFHLLVLLAGICHFVTICALVRGAA